MDLVPPPPHLSPKPKAITPTAPPHFPPPPYAPPSSLPKQAPSHSKTLSSQKKKKKKKKPTKTSHSPQTASSPNESFPHNSGKKPKPLLFGGRMAGSESAMAYSWCEQSVIKRVRRFKCPSPHSPPPGAFPAPISIAIKNVILFLSRRSPRLERLRSTFSTPQQLIGHKQRTFAPQRDPRVCPRRGDVPRVHIPRTPCLPPPPKREARSPPVGKKNNAQNRHPTTIIPQPPWPPKTKTSDSSNAPPSLSPKRENGQ